MNRAVSILALAVWVVASASSLSISHCPSQFYLGMALLCCIPLLLGPSKVIRALASIAMALSVVYAY